MGTPGEPYGEAGEAVGMAVEAEGDASEAVGATVEAEAEATGEGATDAVGWGAPQEAVINAIASSPIVPRSPRPWPAATARARPGAHRIRGFHARSAPTNFLTTAHPTAVSALASRLQRRAAV